MSVTPPNPCDVITGAIARLPLVQSVRYAERLHSQVGAIRDRLLARLILSEVKSDAPASLRWETTEDYYDDGTCSTRLALHRVTLVVGDKRVDIYDIEGGDLGDSPESFDDRFIDFWDSLKSEPEDCTDVQQQWVAQQLGISQEAAEHVIDAVVTIANNDLHLCGIDLRECAERAIDTLPWPFQESK